MPRRAAVPTTARTPANRSGPQSERHPPATGPEGTLARLAHIPYVPLAAWATERAALGLVPGTGQPWLMM